MSPNGPTVARSVAKVDTAWQGATTVYIVNLWHRHRRFGRTAVVVTVVGTTIAAMIGLGVALVPISGNISPNAITMDGNLYPADAASGGTTRGPDCSTNAFGTPNDWVKNCTPLTQAEKDASTVSATTDVATGVVVGQSGAVQAGHWQGVRIVDGLNQGEKDQFLSGGKENDVSTWNVGAGSIGSAKYDISQAYLANNNSNLFLGMERSGNNGTTAFDFEFNQNAPSGQYIPTRAVGDKLLTFEMQGSGGSGSAVAHYFNWSGSAYVETSLPAGITSVINQVAVASAPWGTVDSNGNWVTSDIGRFEFAEASVPLSIITGGTFNPCAGNSRYVEIRTRSSATATSDLKDTTKIFNYQFTAPTAPTTTLAGTCTQSFTFASSVASPSWQFTLSAAQYNNGNGVTLSGHTGTTLSAVSVDSGGVATYTSSDASGEVDVNLPAGVGSATVGVVQTATAADTGCSANDSKTVTVYRQLGATATLTPRCGHQFDYSATASGGKGTLSYSWQFQKNTGTTASPVWTNEGSAVTQQSGTFTTAGSGSYRGVLTVKDEDDTATSGKGQCTKIVNSAAVDVYDVVGASVSLTGDCDNTFGYSATGSGGNGTYNYSWTIEKNTGTIASPVWTTAKTFTDGPTSGASTGQLDVDTFNSGANGDGQYRARVTVTDTTSTLCQGSGTSNVIDVVHALTASASKDATNTTFSAAALTGSSASGASLQWQRFDGTNWVNISGATSSTLSYSAASFESDTGNTSATSTETIGTDSYKVKIWTALLRLHASRTVNGSLCTVDSSTVTVKKAVGIDP